ncbi:hypothetical protein [Pedobacter steynii]|uniref:DUF3592 domain-containing protein n=1 Tax=Pedobacter steynii TaxID=430522 RepID=A0A1D7QNF4_9SPHI|nr:hypothetical protein [Pedobacter steynii]AOM80200.1 hypothetical protein BFS30_25375 [Pedobacter steynii]
MKYRKKKKPELLLLNDSKWIAPVLLIISLIFVYFIPKAIMYADYKIIGMLPFFVGLFQGYREKIELEKFGVWTTSIVVDRKYVKNRHNPGEWLIKCSYQATHQSYETAYHTDSKPAHPVGKKIRIIYSSQYPKIYTLDYEWKR